MYARARVCSSRLQPTHPIQASTDGNQCHVVVVGFLAHESLSQAGARGVQAGRKEGHDHGCSQTNQQTLRSFQDDTGERGRRRARVLWFASGQKRATIIAAGSLTTGAIDAAVTMTTTGGSAAGQGRGRREGSAHEARKECQQQQQHDGTAAEEAALNGCHRR